MRQEMVFNKISKKWAQRNTRSSRDEEKNFFETEIVIKQNLPRCTYQLVKKLF